MTLPSPYVEMSSSASCRSSQTRNRTCPSLRRTSVNTGGLSDSKVPRPLLRSALAQTPILVFEFFLISRNVDFVSFTHVREFKLVDITAYVLNFVNEIEDGFVVSITVTSDLSG